MRSVNKYARAQYLLPIACVLAAALVAAAEFSTLFEFNRGTSGEPLKTTAAADRHYYALLILAIFAVAATAVAVVAGSRPAAAAVAVAGGISLLIFLLVDLPDVNVEGPLDEPYFFTSKAEPASGFWLELVGTLSLALAGGALATLSSEQLRALVPAGWRGAEEAGREKAEEPEWADRPKRGQRPVRKGAPDEADAASSTTRTTRRRERAG